MAAIALAAPAAANAAPDPQPYGHNDFGGFWNVLPPGQGQSVNAAQIGSFLATGQRPPHDQDQLEMYSDLVYAAPGMNQAKLRQHYKDATFGVRAGDVERTYSPRGDVTIVRDNFGVPRVYGSGRAGAMFGAGYIAAEDRMFFIDALRHAGRAQLSSFAGGSAGNRAMDRSVWADTPYRSDAELNTQFELADELYGAAGRQAQRDVTQYVAGINKRISEIRANPLLLPGEYPLLGHPGGPEDWTVADVISVASLVAGIFGKGGGGEVNSALVLEEARERFGKRKGFRVWKDFRRANDREAPVTVKNKRFRYGKVTKKARKRKEKALPDPGTVQPHRVLVSSTAEGQSRSSRSGSRLPDVGDMLGSLRELDGASNALLVSARESESGRPLAVFGPQVSYYSPQILLEEELHAPGGPTGPPVDVRGTAFPGTNLVAQLSHGRDYAWSATSAGHDIIDTFAAKLCEPDGSRPTLDSMHYRFHGRCEPIQVLQRKNSWQSSPGDTTPSGSETLRAERTAYGIVTHRAMIDGKPHAYTKLRATYFHEVDSVFGFTDFNDPTKMESPAEFMRAACKIQYTFHWFYADDRHIAYFNSGINPVRSRKAHPDLPTPGKRKYEWRGWEPLPLNVLRGATATPQTVNPRTNLAREMPCRKHPQTVDQRYITNWNNKAAHGFRASDGQYGYGPIYRSLRLERRIRQGIRGDRRMNRSELVDAMADAGTVDLRGSEVLPIVLRVIKPRKVSSPPLRAALDTLRGWVKRGAHRRDKNRDGTYDDTEAVRIMDAWWPRLVTAEFRPTMGGELFEAVQRVIGFHNAPGPVGSAFASGWYGYVHKDLRMLLAKKGKKQAKRADAATKRKGKQRVRSRFSRIYCGGGRKRVCRKRLLRSLDDALDNASDAELYPGQPDEDCEGLGDAQWCTDAVRHTATGAVTQPPIHWIDRPTFQQAVEIRGHR